MVVPTAAPRPVRYEAELAPTRSRRRLLAGLVGGVVAAMGGRLVDPMPAEAAAGNPAILGKANSAGSKSTSISATVGGAAAILGKNASSTGYGVYGQSTATSGSTRGVYGRTASPSGTGVYAYQVGASHGTGVALRADGVHSTNETGPGVWVTSNGSGSSALQASSSLGTGIVASGNPYAGEFQGALMASSLESGPHTFDPTSAPDAPALGGVLWIANIGGGKRALFVRFPTGSPIQLAIEP